MRPGARDEGLRAMNRAPRRGRANAARDPMDRFHERIFATGQTSIAVMVAALLAYEPAVSIPQHSPRASETDLARLNDALERGFEAIKAGRFRPARDVIADLRHRLR